MRKKSCWETDLTTIKKVIDDISFEFSPMDYTSSVRFLQSNGDDGTIFAANFLIFDFFVESFPLPKQW